MTETRLLAAWLRSLAGLAALAGLLVLSGCGGGSGAQNNVFSTPGPLTVLPGAAIAYSGTPIVLTISGGTPPYQAFSSNSAVVPVVQAVAGSTMVLVPGTVSGDIDVTITVQDDTTGRAVPPTSTTAALTVRAAPLLNSLTITPNNADCGTTAICSGQNGTATVTVLGPQGGPLAGRQVRFDVVSGPYGITTTNPAQPVVSTLTVISDANGVASVIIKANASAPTQFAQLRATDLTSGQQLLGNFLIQGVTDGTKILTVVPSSAKITGAFTGICSTGFVTEYFIYGGTPPYRVTSTFPNSVTLSGSPVNASGGSFRATTKGDCVDPLTFSIVDASGLQTTATLSNVEGTGTVPAPAALKITPATYTQPVCSGTSIPFAVSGGTPSYNVTAANAGGAVLVTPPTGGGAGLYLVGPLTGPSITTIQVLDQSAPQQSVTATLTCTA